MQSDITQNDIYCQLGRALCDGLVSRSLTVSDVKRLVREAADEAQQCAENERVHRAVKHFVGHAAFVVKMLKGVPAWLRLRQDLQAIQPAEWWDEGAGI